MKNVLLLNIEHSLEMIRLPSNYDVYEFLNIHIDMKRTQDPNVGMNREFRICCF